MSIPSYTQFVRACDKNPALTRHQVGKNIGLGDLQTIAFAARLASERGELKPGQKQDRMRTSEPIRSKSTKKRSKR